MGDNTLARAFERRLLIEKTLAYLSAGMCLLTVVWSDWIELVFRVDPDGGNGALEWGLLVVLVATTVMFATAARADHRRLLELARNVAYP